MYISARHMREIFGNNPHDPASVLGTFVSDGMIEEAPAGCWLEFRHKTRLHRNTEHRSGGIMAEVVAIKATSWLTAMAVEHLSGYFAESVEEGIGRWSNKLQNIIASPEMKAIEGMHTEFNEGMCALSASISAVNQETKDGTAAVLRAIMEQSEYQRHDEQRKLFNEAVDAIEDLTSGMYAVGNSRNIGLVETASINAMHAARYRNGNFILKIKAYRLWLATEYMHQATLHSCRDAKKTALTILGRKILVDDDITSICNKYSSPRTSRERPPELTETGWQSEEAGWVSWSGSGPLPSEVLEAMKFLLDVISSTAMLEPLDEAVSCRDVITAEEDGALTLGPSVPRNIIFAIGRFCASNPQVAAAYPAVRAIALPEWEAGKEKLAMDNFFVSMGGENWEHSGKWTDRDADLRERFGLTLENGHITKISLAGNNLEGVLNDDIADLEHLRELVLHGNKIYGAVPPRLQSLITSKPHMVVKGLPAPGMKSGPTVDRKPSFASSRDYSVDCSAAGSFLGETLTSSSASLHGTDASFGSSSMKRTKKKNAWGKSVSKFLKEAVGANMDAGFESYCDVCGGKMKPNKKKTGLVCKRCFEEASSQTEGGEMTPW